MRFLRISPMQVVNLEAISRVETYESHDIRYVTIYFVDGHSYRCTEDESTVLLPAMDRVTEKLPALD